MEMFDNSRFWFRFNRTFGTNADGYGINQSACVDVGLSQSNIGNQEPAN